VHAGVRPWAHSSAQSRVAAVSHLGSSSPIHACLALSEPPCSDSSVNCGRLSHITTLCSRPGRAVAPSIRCQGILPAARPARLARPGSRQDRSHGAGARQQDVVVDGLWDAHDRADDAGPRALRLDGLRGSRSVGLLSPDERASRAGRGVAAAASRSGAALHGRAPHEERGPALDTLATQPAAARGGPARQRCRRCRRPRTPCRSPTCRCA